MIIWPLINRGEINSLNLWVQSAIKPRIHKNTFSILLRSAIPSGSCWSQRIGACPEYSRRAKRCSFISSSVPTSHSINSFLGSPFLHREGGKGVRFRARVIRERSELLPRPLFHGRGGLIAERRGGEGSADPREHEKLLLSLRHSERKLL
jgi:hypothetical protein